MTPLHDVPIKSTVFIDSVLSAIIPSPDDDSRCLFAISLLYAMTQNDGELSPIPGHLYSPSPMFTSSRPPFLVCCCFMLSVYAIHVVHMYNKFISHL